MLQCFVIRGQSTRDLSVCGLGGGSCFDPLLIADMALAVQRLPALLAQVAVVCLGWLSEF